MRATRAEREVAKQGHIFAGVDVGGTYTDFFLLDEQSGAVTTLKTPSTRDDQSRGFLEGLLQGVADPGALSLVVHGTTVGTNALLERKGAKAGLVASEGFRDVLEMRRRDRPRTWGLAGDFEPVIPRNLRLEVPERTLADGRIRTALDETALRAAGRELLAAGAQAIVVAFINAHANPENEKRAVEILRAMQPGVYVNAASDILCEIREFERTSTAALNAYLQPPVSAYLERLAGKLRESGADAELLIVQSNGGLMTVPDACERPVRTALSGPAAGVVAAAEIARQAGFDDVVTCDMGGTSFDVSLVADGRAALAPQSSVDFGMVIRGAMVEVTTIGAGGGSLASVDAGGMLRVGPESAGSQPGPACYAMGGSRPTVTDANLALGRIDASAPIGGRLKTLDEAAARRALEAHVAGPLSLGIDEAAAAVLRVAAAHMAGALRLVSIERGYDPARFVAMTFGGGGGLFAGALLREVGLKRVLAPRYPGVISALGCVIADMRHDFVETIGRELDALDAAELLRRIQAISARGDKMLDAASALTAHRSRRFELDMSYLGQTHTLAVPLPEGVETWKGLEREVIRGAFEKSYQAAYGRLLSGIGIRVLNVRGAVIGHRPAFDMGLLKPPAHADLEKARRGTRAVYAEGKWMDAEIFARLELPVGAVLEGPAVLQQPDATVFVDPGLRAEVDALGNLLLSRSDEAGA